MQLNKSCTNQKKEANSIVVTCSPYQLNRKLQFLCAPEKRQRMLVLVKAENTQKKQTKSQCKFFSKKGNFLSQTKVIFYFHQNMYLQLINFVSQSFLSFGLVTTRPLLHIQAKSITHSLLAFLFGNFHFHLLLCNIQRINLKYEKAHGGGLLY